MDEPSDDPRSEQQKRDDWIGEQVILAANAVTELARMHREQMERQQNSNTNELHVTHKSEGLGAWGAASVVACFATWILMILVAMEIHDLRAWRDIHQNHISALEAKGKSP